MGVPRGYSEKVAKLPSANIQWEVFLNVLARVVPDTGPGGDKFVAR
jgi:hypothetical protein